MEENRVLTLEEVLALPDGAAVWVDEARPEFKSGINKVLRPHDGEWGLSLEPPEGEGCGPYWPETWPDYVGTRFRVWLREPTPAELAANPWPS